MSVVSCPNCGRVNPGSFSRCSHCGNKLPKAPAPAPRPSVSDRRAAEGPRQTPVQPVGEQTGGTLLTGTVTSVGGLRYEPPDFDGYRFSSQLIIFLVTLPVLFLFIVVFLALSLAASILRLFTLANLLNPFNMIITMHFFALIFPFRMPQRREAPVCVFRLQDDEDREHQVRVKGVIEGDYPAEGDQVEIEGRWRNGTFLLLNGFNHQVQARLRVRPSRWRWVFLFLAVLIAVGVCLIAISDY